MPARWSATRRSVIFKSLGFEFPFTCCVAASSVLSDQKLVTAAAPAPKNVRRPIRLLVGILIALSTRPSFYSKVSVIF